jgi:hypothetical protein
MAGEEKVWRSPWTRQGAGGKAWIQCTTFEEVTILFTSLVKVNRTQGGPSM